MELLGRKLGMTQIFNEQGDRVPVTVLQAGPCVVVQKKTSKTDGYSALQLGFAETKEKHLSKAALGHLKKAQVGPRRHLYEVTVEEAELDSFELGQEITCEGFEAGKKVDVAGLSKGRGFTGVIKRHNYHTHGQTHGTHEFFRHGGAQSAGSYPGRIFPGKKMAGQHGNAKVTTLGLSIEKVDAEQNLLYVRGSVPGHANGLVRLRPSVKG